MLIYHSLTDIALYCVLLCCIITKCVAVCQNLYIVFCYEQLYSIIPTVIVI